MFFNLYVLVTNQVHSQSYIYNFIQWTFFFCFSLIFSTKHTIIVADHMTKQKRQRKDYDYKLVQDYVKLQKIIFQLNNIQILSEQN